jgi:hypothetical protein
METVKMERARVQLAIDAVGSKAALAVRLDRTVRQIWYYLEGYRAQRHIADKIEEIIREYERSQQKKAS